MDNNIERPKVNNLALASIIIGVLGFLIAISLTPSCLFISSAWHAGYCQPLLREGNLLPYLLFNAPLSIVSLILGIISLKQIKFRHKSGRKYAIWGILVSILAIITPWIAIFYFLFCCFALG